MSKYYSHQTQTKLHSELQYDLFRKNIIEESGLPDDSYHFFFICTNYTLARNKHFRCLLHSTQLPIIDCHLLLWGDETQNDDTNQLIFSSVQKFIRGSGRWTKIELCSLQILFIYLFIYLFELSMQLSYHNIWYRDIVFKVRTS